MKSIFAKIIDGTLGAVLLFFAAYAVMRYYLPNSLAVFAAISIAMTAALLIGLTGRKKDEKYKLSSAAENMFYDFMFLRPNAPATLLAKGLRSRGENPKVHGSGVYLGSTAAYAVFDKTLDAGGCARLVAKARHYGANRIVLLLKAPPAATVDVKDMKMIQVTGDDVYKLFASLKALPPRKFERTKKPRFHMFRGALGKDKTLKYLMLAASLFGVCLISGFHPMTIACATIATILFITSLIYNIVKAAKKSSSV